MKNLYHLAAIRCVKVLSILFFSLPFASSAQELMRANLYIVDNNGTTLVDGNLTNYNSIYSNAVDINDAWKMINPGINFGIKREGIDLVVERRTIIGQDDTTYFRMWNLPQKNYQLKMMLKNLDHSGLHAILKDNFMHTETAIGLNDTTYVSFSVNSDPASADQFRFQLIYTTLQSSPVDVLFTSVQARRTGKDVVVGWHVTGEQSLESYSIEHSSDGRNFSEISKYVPSGSSSATSYYYNDLNAGDRAVFYRIKANSYGGRIQYSSIAKIGAFTAEKEITVFPNPVVNKTVQLQFSNQIEGKYQIAVVHSNGVVQRIATIEIESGQTVQSVFLPNIKPGIYQLQIVGPGNIKSVKTIQVL